VLFALGVVAGLQELTGFLLIVVVDYPISVLLDAAPPPGKWFGKYSFAVELSIYFLFGTVLYTSVGGFLGWSVARICLRFRRPFNLGVCQKCGYNLRGNVTGICPECGTEVHEVSSDQADKPEI